MITFSEIVLIKGDSHTDKTQIIRPKRNTCVSANPTDPISFFFFFFFFVLFCFLLLLFSTDPANFIALQKKIKRFSYLLTLKKFQKIGPKKTSKMSELQT